MKKSKPTQKSQLAYYDTDFLNGDDGRPLRILAEYLVPFSRLQKKGIRDTIVFFGSARMTEDGPLGHYYTDARKLAMRLTHWSQSLPDAHRYVICSGGGGGIMAAANRGASEAGGPTIGFNISLPHEQRPNPFITPELNFEFHYFFMRKLWFSHLARALIVFPGGFGTLDEFLEILTLAQTKKLDRNITILLYGKEFWNEVFNFGTLIKYHMIDEEDLKLFHFVDDVDSAFSYLTHRLQNEKNATCPAIAKNRDSEDTQKK